MSNPAGWLIQPARFISFRVISMSVFSKRLLIALAISVGIGTCAIAVSAVVIYKPWGVHDLQREEYDELRKKIDERWEIANKPRPIAHIITVNQPAGLKQPGEVVEMTVKVSNLGKLELELDQDDAWPSEVSVDALFPVFVAPRETVRLTMSWQVPTNEELLDDLKGKLRCNDLLQNELTIEPTCEIAKPFLIQHPELSAVNTGNTALVAVNRIFSQQYDDFFVDNIEVDGNLLVEVAPELDSEILRHHNAKSGMILKVTYAGRSAPGRVSLPVKVTAWTDQDRQDLEFTFVGRVKSPIAFYGPDLDTRRGYRLGVIKIGTDRSWSFFARIDREHPVDDLVVEVVPEQLEATIAKARKDKNDFKVTIKPKSDATPVDFQSSQTGYVKLSSKSNESISNWIPIQGVIVHPE
jgi:hypothetical protein